MVGFGIFASNCHHRHGKTKNIQKDVPTGYEKRKKTSRSNYRDRVAGIILV